MDAMTDITSCDFSGWMLPGASLALLLGDLLFTVDTEQGRKRVVDLDFFNGYASLPEQT